MNDIIIDTDSPRLCEEVENTRKLVGELNTGYHSPDEVRALLERIWGQPVDASVRMFPPFYTAFGKMTRVGKDVFINFGEDAFKKLKGDNKELMIVPGANHTDLYDNLNMIPFDKIDDFLRKHLNN